ncbi:circumsporozoite protein-like [Clytia hemisphaerica]|uniref:circumsporozoite protein-like n=1 Tax=Clytia hemisphaerica TaxID=252671 RepID=UPI0034D4D93F
MEIAAPDEVSVFDNSSSSDDNEISDDMISIHLQDNGDDNDLSFFDASQVFKDNIHNYLMETLLFPRKVNLNIRGSMDLSCLVPHCSPDVSPYRDTPIDSPHCSPDVSPYRDTPIDSPNRLPDVSPYRDTPIDSPHCSPDVSPYRDTPIDSPNRLPDVSPYRDTPINSPNRSPDVTYRDASINSPYRSPDASPYLDTPINPNHLSNASLGYPLGASRYQNDSHNESCRLPVDFPTRNVQDNLSPNQSPSFSDQHQNQQSPLE